MNAKQIADTLCEYRAAKNRIRELRIEIAKLAGNLGLDNNEAMKTGAEFLDGYLVALGHLQDHRRKTE